MIGDFPRNGDVNFFLFIPLEPELFIPFFFGADVMLLFDGISPIVLPILLRYDTFEHL